MNFFIVSWVDWNSHLHSRPHQIAREALRRNHRVLYLNPGRRPAKKEGNLEVWNPFSNTFFDFTTRLLRRISFTRKSSPSGEELTPMRRLLYRPYEDGNRWSFGTKFVGDRLVRRKLRTFFDPAGENAILFEQPFPLAFSARYLKRLGYTVIYDMIDDWSAYEDAPAFFGQSEPYLLQNADIVTATAKPLHEKALRYNSNSRLCPNAADVAHFERARQDCERPGDMPEHAPIIGFFGTMREWFDAGLLRYAALERPAFEFCLIGDYSRDVFDALKDLTNVHFLGPKGYAVLPQYLRHFDAAIIPFVINDLIRSTNPIKVYEYLAGGKPVVATDIPEVEGMPFVYVSKDQKKFVRNLDLAVAATVSFEEIDGFLKDHTWSKRFDVIEMSISECRNASRR